MISTAVYINSGGRCTCARHAGHELAASIAANPEARLHIIHTGDWERITDHDVREAYGLDADADITTIRPACEECDRATRQTGQDQHP